MFNFYQEILMDHYRNPRNNGVIDAGDFHSEQRNSSCGDEILFTGVVKNNVLCEVLFKGKGCVISQATASLLSEYAKNKSLETILAFDKDDLTAMLGMQLGPVRLLCGLLSLTALHHGIKDYKKQNE
ncbi:MAG TPA: iron-sulfur cluster assembly scaffold protein [Candidatus Babeliales bacterium]|jgi:nitrogen fixation NifU-like protein|nr:iron-sulfur cluster assembly scaffold protein [Candidatus Babeliales bacterium]